MKVKTINTDAQSFKANTFKFHEWLPQRILDAQDEITKALLEEGGGDKFLRIVPETELHMTSNLNLTATIASTLPTYRTDSIATGKILVFVSKQAKSFIGKIKIELGLDNPKLLTIKDSNPKKMIETIKDELKNENSKI